MNYTLNPMRNGSAKQSQTDQVGKHQTQFWQYETFRRRFFIFYHCKTGAG